MAEVKRFLWAGRPPLGLLSEKTRRNKVHIGYRSNGSLKIGKALSRLSKEQIEQIMSQEQVASMMTLFGYQVLQHV